MVALQKIRIERRPVFSEKAVDNHCGVQAAIHGVAEKDQGGRRLCRRPGGMVFANGVKQVIEETQPAVNVARCVRLLALRGLRLGAGANAEHGADQSSAGRRRFGAGRAWWGGGSR